MNDGIVVTGGSGFIGTNLVEALLETGAEVTNVDNVPPINPVHAPYWVRGDILDAKAMRAVFQERQPTALVHLAARTDCVEDTTVDEGYAANVTGVENVLRAAADSPSLQRAVITSTQYVCRPGCVPRHDQDFNPHTVYGQSKVRTEQITRQFGLSCTWTIIRPTNIWGPWHFKYRDQLFRTLRSGLYCHPGRQACIKSYGYVGNVVHQILRILDSPPERVHARTLYVGDPPLNLLDWVNGFSRALAGRNVRIVPRWILRTMALMGDAISRVTGRRFLITSSRYRSMIEDYITPMDETFEVLGPPRYSMEEGISQTLEWLTKHDPAN